MSLPVSILVFDSDGVLSSGGKPFPHAIEIIDELNHTGFPYYILTNNPFLDTKRKSRGYAHQGFHIAPERIFGAAHPLKQALANVPKKTGRLYAVGDEDPTAYLREVGFEIDNHSDDIDGILLLDDDFGWDADRVTRVLELLLLRPYLPLIVPNPDMVFPDRPGHLYLTTGAWSRMLVMLCAEKGVRVHPINLGKPFSPIYESLQRVLDENFPNIPKSQVLMLGDSPATDILGANHQGWMSALIETGNHRFGRDREDCQATYTYKSLVEFWTEFKS